MRMSKSRGPNLAIMVHATKSSHAIGMAIHRPRLFRSWRRFTDRHRRPYPGGKDDSDAESEPCLLIGDAHQGPKRICGEPEKKEHGDDAFNCRDPERLARDAAPGACRERPKARPQEALHSARRNGSPVSFRGRIGLRSLSLPARQFRSIGRLVAFRRAPRLALASCLWCHGRGRRL